MRKILFFAVAMSFCSISFSFAGHLGPAQPSGKGGQLSLGTGIFQYSGEWNSNADAKQTQAYVQLGYAFTDRFEIYIQGGAANLEVGKFDDGYRPFGTAGARWLLTNRSPVGVGLFIQGTYFSDYEGRSLDGTTPVKLKFLNAYELQGGVALQTILEGAILYGGPLFYLREGDFEATTGTGVTTSGTFEEDSNFGAFVGIRWPVKHGINIELESHLKTKFSVGGAISFNF